MLLTIPGSEIERRASLMDRVFVVWTRLLRSDGISVQLGPNAADELGRAGNAGVVDNHYVERFGSAILLSLVGGASQYLGSYGWTNTS